MGLKKIPPLRRDKEPRFFNKKKRGSHLFICVLGFFSTPAEAFSHSYFPSQKAEYERPLTKPHPLITHWEILNKHSGHKNYLDIKVGQSHQFENLLIQIETGKWIWDSTYSLSYIIATVKIFLIPEDGSLPLLLYEGPFTSHPRRPSPPIEHPLYALRLYMKTRFQKREVRERDRTQERLKENLSSSVQLRNQD